MKNFKSIAQRNAEFANMTVMQKRVALAKDVLAQLEMKKFIPTPGTYLDSRDGTDNTTRETCNVCALGALTVSLIDGDAFNEWGSSKVNCYDVLTAAGLWTYKETEAIEHAFEAGHLVDENGRWMEQPTAETRMKEIMMNIVRNEGMFIASELPFKA